MSPERPPASPSAGHHSQTPPRQSNQQLGISPGDGQGRQGGSWSHQGQLDPSSYRKHEGLLPAFSAKHYSQLPTPQSPSDSNRFPVGVNFSPESPIPQSQGSYTAPGGFIQRLGFRSSQEDPSLTTSHILTPASSPFNPRHSSYRNDNPATPSDQSSRFMNISRPFTVDSMLNAPVTPKNGQSQAMSSDPVEQSATPSALSSPFVAKATIPKTPSRQPPPVRADDIFSTPMASSRPSSQPSTCTADHSMRPPGGEMERIRQAMREDQLNQLQEAESRRPDYLKRAKRSLDEADPDALDDDGRARIIAVGIMESPQKGRRLKLFQETSEESFEESLMAGGYGRYRTADWVRQPQPISLPLGTTLPVISPFVPKPEEPQEGQPPSEKEIRKQQRLAAFRSNRSEGRLKAKLYPVELEGKGRVLLDIPNELPQVIGEESGSSAKKRGARGKKKKGTDFASLDKKALVDAAAALAAEDLVDKPNWPDTEFPWRLRVEEREEMAKAEEEERLKWIERFLDRDSDDESDNPPPSRTPVNWDAIYENAPEKRHRPGRGKMVSLLAHPEDPRKAYRVMRSGFYTDPGDAKHALLSKRSVRALSYRKRRRERELNDEDSDSELCICGGVDDGRELVQCDGCETWYHLQCIGIRHIAQLGREEDPWYCRYCFDMDVNRRSPSPEPAIVPMREPTLVPTDDTPRERSVDTPFFQPSIPDSPNWLRVPRTPTRNNSFSDLSLGEAAAAEDFYKFHAVMDRSYASDGYNSSQPNLGESPFDPTSTPSRGIRFNASFATPKSQVWPRPTYSYQTPLQGHNKIPSNRGSFGGTGSLSAVLDENGTRPLPFNRLHPSDESPVRRNLSTDATQTRRPLELSVSSRLLDESPVMRMKGKERSFDFGRLFPV